MSRSVRAISLLAFTAVAIAPCAAQCPPGAVLPQDLTNETTMPDPGAAAVRWRAGQDAVKASDFAAASKHFTAALEFHPCSPVLLLELALAQRDPGAAAVWSERFVRAASDAQGRLKLDAAMKKRVAAARDLDTLMAPAQGLAAMRAAAIAEVARFADKNKAVAKNNASRALLVRWASELLLELGGGAPQALLAATPAVAKVQQGFVPDHDVVFQALVRLVQQKPGEGEAAVAVEDRRVRAARILVGLHRQAALPDLQGPVPPSLDKYVAEARALLAGQRDTIVSAGKVWSIAELEAMSPPDRVRFTEQHRDWRAPGLALSATGRYRIETTCGHETLLGAAKTVELHHTRLANHFGSDPFAQRLGVVRIVPEVTDLETEGAPYWWAGGFQAGDATTVRFAWDGIAALGRLLTHELTHRFDGVLRPFLGSWYLEGHAVWTGDHYGRMTDTQFVESHLAIGTLSDAYYKGYASKEKLVELLQGRIAEYRDNYVAGYALYAFLRSVPPDRPRYRDALPSYEKHARGGQSDPVAWFTSCFCDGKQGRPASFDEFVADWERCLRACWDWRNDRKKGHEWLEQYRPPATESTPDVKDAPTWSWGRTRAEPFFGQGHATDATHLLHEARDVDGTIAAAVWSTTVDGWRIDTSRVLLEALRAGKSADATQAFAAIASRRFPLLGATEAPLLLTALPKTKALLDGLGQRATGLAASAADGAAAFAADQARIGAFFGLPRHAGLPAGGWPAVARALGSSGWSESSLTGYDERRAAGLWYAADGDLHVGREKPREGTGNLDRTAHQRHAFVHTTAWHAPGSYVLRGRVYVTTSYASGAIVLGHVRRDRNLRLFFTTGDFDYATGRSEHNEAPGKVTFSWDGLWERDEDMPRAKLRSHSVDVSVDAPWFEYALHVRGPRVLVEINGEAVHAYAVHDGSPVEGPVGFAMSMGAIRVHQPTVQRVDGTTAGAAAGLALDEPSSATIEDLTLLPVRGVPLHADGTLVLWLPKVADGSPGDLLPRAMRVLTDLMQAPHEHPQPWVLAVPRETTAEQRAAALATIAEVRGEGVPVLEHVVGAPFTGSDPWVLFVDGAGTLRAAAAVNDTHLHSRVARWSSLFRSR